MDKSVTFSFSSTNYEGTEAKETLPFEKLGIDEDMNDREVKEALEKILQAWVWDKLNISYSIVIQENRSNSKGDFQ